MNIVLIFPTQLFENNKLINENSIVYILEHKLFFTDYQYHKLKLILHRSTMKFYYDYIIDKYNCKVKYIEFNTDLETIFKSNKNKSIKMYDPVDHGIMEELNYLSDKYNIDLVIHDTPSFMETTDELKEYYSDNSNNISQTSFYIWQRKKYNILVDKNYKPIGGKWTFDKDNREPYTPNFNYDANFKENKSEYIQEAIEYIKKHFNNNIGTHLVYYLPIDFLNSKKHLTKFITERLDCFGPSQDAVSDNIIFGCHSVLSPMLNTGLLTPKYVIDKILNYYNKHKNTINFSSIEGIIRQIIGWRSWMRYNYIFKHKELINNNYFNHNRKIDDSWYSGNTGIGPIDEIIKKVLEYGYAHHIERLMYLGNFMLLSEFDPLDVYEWFQSMFIDSYTVFMETNVYGMSQYSSGPLLVSRPYFSSSNYIDKMSSYKKKPNIFNTIKLKNENYEWYEIWDALYYNFINKNKNVFKSNYSTARSVAQWNRKSNTEVKEKLKIAKLYLSNY